MRSTYLFLALTAVSAIAIEGHDPTPRFLRPDFSIEEERVTWPADLIDFFKLPFIEYLRQDTTRWEFASALSLNSSKEADGSAFLSMEGFIAELSGRQSYFGDGPVRKMFRTAQGWGGYAGLIEKRYPYAVKADGRYSAFRGEYQPSTYQFTAGAEGYIPIGNSLLSLNFAGTRESWAQNIGAFPRTQPTDRPRAEISNSVAGEAAFRSMPGEFTGFEVFAKGETSTRYEPDRWQLLRTVMSGGGNLIYDSRWLRLALGAGVHRTWRGTAISPKMNFEVIWGDFAAFATVEGYTKPIERYETIATPRATLPPNAEFMEVPIAVTAGGMIEIIAGQTLSARAKYLRAENKPVIWNPKAEAPTVSLEAATHQSFNVKLASEFGILRNELSITLQRDIALERHIPTEPEEIFADTVSLQLSDLRVFAGGYRRMGQPYRGKMQETNVGLGASYRFGTTVLSAAVENILGEAIFDDIALEFYDDVKFSLNVSLDF